MRMLTVLFLCAVFTILGFVFTLFMTQNVQHTDIMFFGHAYTTNLALVVAGAAAVGFALALLLLLPSRIAVGLYSRALYHEAFQLDRRLARLLDQRGRWLEQQEHVQDEYEHMLNEHEHILQQFHQLLSERDRLLSEHGRLLMEHHSALARLAALDAASLRVVQPVVTASTPAASSAADAPATWRSDSARGMAPPDVGANTVRASGAASQDAPKPGAPLAEAQVVYP